jgi:glutamate racemase
MHILITDSGVGGVSVVAYAERFIREHGFSEPVKLTFANAAPENDYGYNSMPNREVKLATFDRFLRSVTERYAPDFIYVACNTLSVLLPETPYFTQAAIPVKGIVETGVDLLLEALAADPRSVAIVFGTQGTIDAGTYSRMLVERGIASERIISQACPGLADTISEDREGTKTGSEIRMWVSRALESLRDRSAPVVACLACTHYGYRKDMFAAAFEEAGIRATVVNPNESAVGDLFPDARNEAENRDVEVSFVTRYKIPDATVEALTWFLEGISPRTVAAMTNYHQVPDLF